MKIAIVGTGISGLTAAHLLHREHEIAVFEADRRLGGHSNTVRADGGEAGAQWIDTGFIVFNDRNYPRFERLLAELGVETQPSHMSFSVSDGGRFEYAGTPLGLFARPAHLLSPSFLAMLRDFFRFNREARQLIGMDGMAPSLGEWLDQRGFSRHFIDRLIVPQASAVWSADPRQMWSFPASFMAEFFGNHGMYSLRNRPRWRTVRGGSVRYVDAISAPWRDRVRLASRVRRVERVPEGVLVEADGCETELFDEVVIAAHSNQALRMLPGATEPEREILGAIPYQPNEAVLHTDTRVMPRRRRAWASWNFHLTEEPARRSTVTYWMNNLQRLPGDRQYLLTLNHRAAIDPARVIGRFLYDHPVFTQEGVHAQQRHAEISGADHIRFCGAYWGWGFHEDGVASAERACAPLLSGRAREAVGA